MARGWGLGFMICGEFIQGSCPILVSVCVPCSVCEHKSRACHIFSSVVTTDSSYYMS